MRVPLAVLAACAGSISSLFAQTVARPDFTSLWPSEDSARAQAGMDKPFDPQRPNGIDAEKPRRDPWRNGDPAFVPRDQRERVLRRESARKGVPFASDQARPSWTSPIAPRHVEGYCMALPGAASNGGLKVAAEPRYSGRPPARWIAEVALLALSAKGTISSTTRDTTGDIGKQPFAARRDPFAQGMQGGIR